eukprot:3914145-Ditylum_brightwellii.AAC.1
MFLRDSARVADKYFDAWKQPIHSTFDGSMRYLLADHEDKLPPLSKIFDPYRVERTMGPNGILRLSHFPSIPLEKKDNKLFECFS